MENVRLYLGELRIGVPLPFDVYDVDGNSLLRRGYVVKDREQMERLIERGAYCSGADAEEIRRNRPAGSGAILSTLSAPHAARVTERISVFAMLAETREKFAALFAAGEGRTIDDATFTATVSRTTRAIMHACTLDGDAAIASILVTRPPRYFPRQAVNVAIVAEIMLKQLGAAEDERASAVAAALTMNLAMVDLMDMMYSQATPPTADQRQQVLQHPAASAQALRARGIADPVWLSAVAQHHEAFDGSGYPSKCKGADISRPAQVLGLADRYCAAITERSHRPGVHPNIALREIFLKHGQAIDPALAAVMLREIGIYPPGTVVVLANGEIGLVVRRTLNANHPVVKALFAPLGQKYPAPAKRLTSKPVYEIKNVAGRDKVADIALESLWSDTEVEVDGAAAG